MGPWRAILLFPVRPGAAAGALRPAAALAAPGPPLLLFLYLAARGCRVPDAAVAATGLLLVVAGLGAGGAFASALARRIVPGAPRRGAHVHLVFAAWSVVLLVLVLLATGSALAAGLAVLVWGVVAGSRVLADDADAGRALVASCTGAAGAIVGVMLAGMLVQERLVMAMPSPSGGGTILVRRGTDAGPGALVLARDPASATLFLARKRDAALVPEAAAPKGPPSGWTEVGRVFFLFGSNGARSF